MPEEVKASWAEQVEEGDEDTLPPVHEHWDPKTNTRIITEYNINEVGKKVKIVKTYKVETRTVSKAVAKRKHWHKFGAAYKDPPGPNSSTTYLGEEVGMQFVHGREIQDNEDTDALSKLKAAKMVTCRICKGDHWTTRCPYKDTLQPIKDLLGDDGEKKPEEETTTTAQQQAHAMGQKSGGKYVPPNMRDGGKPNRGGESMAKSRDEAATVRVTNLSEDTRESDLQELFRPFGQIQRIYLAKDKNTGQSKGFAFINFLKREDAARAIKGVSGFGYDHLILNVEWAKPSQN